MSAEAEAFAALDSIMDGRWDRSLHRLHGAIHLRQKTDEYRESLIAEEAAYRGIPYESRLFPGETHYTNSNTDRG